jgi:dihydromethanopterin reductase
MLEINAIVAIGSAGQMGHKGRLPWLSEEFEEQTKADLAWFARMTAGGVLVVGRRTYEEMLAMGFQNKDRIISVWSRDLNTAPGDLIGILAGKYPGRAIWICGGGQTFECFRPFIHRWHISRIPYYGPADVRFNPVWLLP